MRREKVGEDRDQRDRGNDDEAEHRAAVLAEGGPERGERRRLGENLGRFFARHGGNGDVSGHGGSSD